jgi:hypothetical protein
MKEKIAARVFHAPDFVRGKIGGQMNRIVTFRANARTAREIWGESSRVCKSALRDLTEKYQLSVAKGDVVMIDGRWYVSHSGLLGIANRKRCLGITTKIDYKASDYSLGRWVFRAVVYKSNLSNCFVGYGDADPSNVSSLVHGAEMRVAETRAVNRALRKAYGIGLCSIEELGASPRPARPSPSTFSTNGSHSNSGASNGQPRLKDQLGLLIRQYGLDANLVKAYAADFCGTETLSGASRELVESFIAHLSTSAKQNRDALVCKLNSYLSPVEAKS